MLALMGYSQSVCGEKRVTASHRKIGEVIPWGEAMALWEKAMRLRSHPVGRSDGELLVRIKLISNSSIAFPHGRLCLTKRPVEQMVRRNFGQEQGYDGGGRRPRNSIPSRSSAWL